MSKNLDSEIDVIEFAKATAQQGPPPPIARAQAADAFHLYMNFVPLAAISRETGIPIPILSSWTYEKDGWKAQRDKLHSDVVESVRQKSVKRLQKVNQISIRLITKGLQAFERRLDGREDKAPTLEETEMLTDIHAKLHKAKLSEEDPEADKKLMGITPKKIIEAINNDPYFKKALIASSSEKEEVELMEQADGVYESADTGSLADPQRS